MPVVLEYSEPVLVLLQELPGVLEPTIHVGTLSLVVKREYPLPTASPKTYIANEPCGSFVPVTSSASVLQLGNKHPEEVPTTLRSVTLEYAEHGLPVTLVGPQMCTTGLTQSDADGALMFSSTLPAA